MTAVVGAHTYVRTAGKLTFVRWKVLMTMSARSCWSMRVTVRSARVTELPTGSGQYWWHLT